MYNVYEHRLVTDELVSSSYATPAWRVARIFNFAIEAIWDSGVGFSATGTIEVSVDGSHWDVLPGSALALSGASGNNTWSVIDIHQNWVRLSIVGVSGSANLNVLVSGKGW